MNAKSIVVVGGGSAGWMCAAYLSAKGCKVTLIESPNVPIIGVGESTLPAMNAFCSELGLSEDQWMAMCSAVHKLGIHHCNWSTDPDTWWHWFIYDRQLQQHQHSHVVNNTLPPQHQLEYGYHVDAVQFGQSIKPLALKNGAVCIVDHVTQVLLDSNEWITSLATEHNGIISADFYVDCTGFAKVLARPVGIEYEPLPELLNDSALACPQPSLDQVNRYTITKAKSAGWMWEIALTHRRGTGYVYSSKYISEQDAVQEYLREYPGTDPANIRKLRFTPEICLNPFHKNVLAVGLSSGFIEPLEATSLFMIQYNIMNFWAAVSTDRSQAVVNRAQRKVVDEIYLHILGHYTLSNRSDTAYWQYYRDLESRLNTRSRIEAKARLADTGKYQHTGLFFPYNWWAMLQGNGIPT